MKYSIVGLLKNTRGYASVPGLLSPSVTPGAFGQADVFSDFHWNKLCMPDERTARTVMEPDIRINYVTLMS